MPSDCTHFGYTEYVCQGCGYTYRDDYQLCVHSVSTWTVVTPATTEQTGESIGICDICGAEQTREDPVLPEPEPEPETEPETQPQQILQMNGASVCPKKVLSMEHWQLPNSSQQARAASDDAGQPRKEVLL